MTRIETTYDKLYENKKQEYLLLQLQQISKELLDLFEKKYLIYI
jgi:hypothetical protein